MRYYLLKIIIHKDIINVLQPKTELLLKNVSNKKIYKINIKTLILMWGSCGV